MNASSKLLIVDTNVFFAKRLEQTLAREGFEVMHFTDASYALTTLEYSPPSAILCAVRMRDFSAHDLPAILHADSNLADIPIIAVGDGGEHALMEAFRAGCDDYIDRRSNPDQIAQQLKQFLRSRQEGFQPTQMLDKQDTALSGNLSHLDLPGVIQMLCHSRQTGALHINATFMDGVMFFNSGDLQHAEAGEAIGDDAVLKIVKSCNGAESGVYKFVPGASTTTRTVLRSATELMLDALRELDEETRDVAEGGIL